MNHKQCRSSEIAERIAAVFLDTPELHITSCLMLERREHIIVAVPALTVAEHIDVAGNICSCRLSVRIHPALDSFSLECLKDTFGDRIIMAVTPSTHAGYQVVCLQEFLPVIPCILTILIRRHDNACLRLTAPYDPEQCPP